MAARWDPRRAVAGYYLATPLFAVADLGFDLPVRIADVIPTGARAAYYAVLFGLGIVCARRPGATPWVGMLESAFNLLVLLLSILLPIWSIADAVAAGGSLNAGLTPFAAVNAVLSGTAITVSFHNNQAAALRHLGGASGARRLPRS